MTKQIHLSWLARLALSEIAERRGQAEQEVLEALVRRAAIAELEHNGDGKSRCVEEVALC